MLTAFWVIGPAAGWLATALRAPDGGPDTTLFLAESPAKAVGVFAASLAMAGVTGIIASRLFGVRSGFFAAGLVLVWPAWTAGTVMGVLRRTQSGATLWTIALEGVLIAAATAALAWVIGRAQPPVPGSVPKPAKKIEIAPWFSLFSISAGVVFGGVAAAAVARSELPGQAIAAAFAAGLAGTIAATAVNIRGRLPVIISGLALLAFVGPASAAVLDGNDAISHLYSGAIMPLARLTPLHWLAGLFLGVPVGASWISGLVKK